MPKKAKKGGEGKGGGKTEEERLLFLQQRAQAEEEMNRKKEEVLTLFLKDKLQKEEKNAAVNLLKLNEGWRSILRQTRAAELRSDLTVLSQTFERQLDGVDSVIKNLERDLQDAERQSAQVRRLHLQHLERLWAQQQRHLEFEQQQWEDLLKQLTSRFSSDREQMLSQSKHKLDDLKDTSFAVVKKHKEVMEDIEKLYNDTITVYQISHNERLASLGLEEAEKLEKMKKKNRMSVPSPCDEEASVPFLRCQQKCLQSDAKTVKKLQEDVAGAQVKLTNLQMGNVSVDRDLTEARDQVKSRTQALRDQLTASQRAARKQLIDLTMQSDQPVKKLQAIIAKGQKVLQVAEMCRKLESEQRTVSSLIPAEKQRQEKSEEPRKESGKEMSALRNVTLSINTSVLQRENLRRQRDALSRENQQLRVLLSQHLDAMTVSDHDLEEAHPLLTVYRAPTTSKHPDNERRHTVIEAVHIVKHSL